MSNHVPERGRRLQRRYSGNRFKRSMIG